MHDHKIHSLATVNYQLPRGETLFHLPLTNILENIQRLFTNNPKIFKDFFACKFVLAANHQQPENIQRLFGQSTAATNGSNQQQLPTAATSNNYQQQQSAASTSSNYQQQQPVATINSSNQQHQPAATTNSSNQQQLSTTAISSINQQQLPTTATSSNYQQQQSAASTSSNNQQHRPVFVLPTSLPQSTTTHVR